ncbi:hexitol phosphatase HxpB [Cyclobacterium roseum]|uniref:hexitol phosphatase HxpB n=1 Tax=Cyclobacterium roseum TaxID=2666137 RepID=UPI001391BF6C|nr:hexitol phosphatase HxpB [Cyclobacterium roseum]
MKDIDTIIFDMDGVLINSEPFWTKAEKEVFSSIGVKLNDKDCEKTRNMTTDAVTRFWFEQQPWDGVSLKKVECQVIDRVGDFINMDGEPFGGVKILIEKLHVKGYKLGLATNSPYRLIPTVLNKLNLANFFSTIISAEHEIEGKPNPAVYLSAATALKSPPNTCVAIEDSVTGLKAAKKAGMATIFLSSEFSKNGYTSKWADFTCNDFHEILELLRV